MAWKIDNSSENYIRLHVNGNVTWGDRLMFIFNKSDCSEVEVNMYFSSYEDEIMGLEDSPILMKFGDYEVQSKILSIKEFNPLHKIAIIQIGFIEKKVLYGWEKQAEEVAVKISTNNSQKIQDAFDINFNSYSMPGLSKALARIEGFCGN